MQSLAGKKALVTGAASGIGRATAIALAKAGAELYLFDVDEVGLESLTTELRGMGTNSIARRCDLADREELDRRLVELLSTWPDIDIVVNNAGLAYYGPTEAMTDRQWDALVAVNLLAPAQIIRRLLPALKQRPEARIVNIASIAGLVGLKRAAAYSLTKFGIVGFSEALRSELARCGVGVITVCPGYVRTNIFRATMTTAGAKHPREPHAWLSVGPDLVAAQVLKAIRKNRGLVVVTEFAKLLWRVKRLFPSLLVTAFGGFSRRHRRRKSLAQTIAPRLDAPARKAA